MIHTPVGPRQGRLQPGGATHVFHIFHVSDPFDRKMLQERQIQRRLSSFVPAIGLNTGRSVA
jgi:hypothetical protein